MKLSLATVCALAIGSVKADKPTLKLDLTETRIHVGGLLHEPTADDLVVLDKIVLSSFNSVYRHVGTEAVDSESKGAYFTDSGNGMIVSSFVTQGNGGGCGQFCDDGWDDWECYINGGCALQPATELEALALKAGNAHAKFEKHLCKALRNTGVDNFAHAQDCVVSFIEKPGTDSNRPTEEDVYESLTGKATDAEITLHGLDKEPAFSEMKFLEAVIVKAHNDAFFQTGYKLDDVQATSFMPAGDAMDGFALAVARAFPTVDEHAVIMPPEVMAYIHETFERAFCRELASSGHEVFAKVDDCHFRFVYNPVQEVLTIMA